jgi:hypothetical protein
LVVVPHAGDVLQTDSLYEFRDRQRKTPDERTLPMLHPAT